MSNPTVLIVEDDNHIAELVAKNVEAAGFDTKVIHDGGEALAAFEAMQPDLLILDVMLPGLDGVEITRRLRRAHNVPILLLTARSSEGDKVLGFEVGADDYLTKPFSTRELVARVRALIRRSGRSAQEETLTRGPLHLDAARREVLLKGARLDVTTLEFDLLLFLARRPGRVYSRDDLMAQVWGDDRIVDPRSIDSLISRLRRKLESDPGSPQFIQTVWGAGYRFAEGAES